MSKKKISFVITVGSTLALGLSAIGIVALKTAQGGLTLTQADEYTLTIDQVLVEGEGPSGYGTKTFETALGNEVKIGFDKLYEYQPGYSSIYPTGMNCLYNGSYVSVIANSEGHGIAGINYVTLYTDNDTYGSPYIAGYFGWEDGSYVDSEKLTFSDGNHQYKFYFDNVQPTFVKFEVVSDNPSSRVGINHIEINYSCVETDNPYETAGDFLLVYRDDHYSVGKYSGTDTDIVFPDRYNDQPVTEIDDKFSTTAISIADVTSVTIPDGYTRIGKYAFEGSKFKSITLPSTLKRIEYRAFASSLLETCNFPASLEYIGTNAFMDAYLTAIDLSATSLTYINDGAFRSNDAATIVLPSTVETIGNYAFISNDCSSLFIPKSVISICSDAFSGIDECTSLTFEDGGTETLTIGGGAFQGIGHIGELKLPERVTEMVNGYTFLGCPNITAYGFIHGGTESTDGRAWVEDGVLYSGTRSEHGSIYLVAYPNAKTTVDFTIPSYVTHISDYGGGNCGKFETLRFSNTDHTVYVTAYSFDGCTNLKHLVFSTGEVNIRWYAFRGSAIRELVLPENVTIGSRAFGDIATAEDPLSLYLETADIPDTWASDWDYDGDVDKGAIKLYFYSETEPATEEEKATHWHYVAGNPTPWNA